MVAHVVVVASIEEVVDVVVVAVLSLHPNQPGVWHVVVLVVALDELDVVVGGTVDVVSSRQPHQPGVLHVSVLVLVGVALVADDVVVGWVFVPFSNFHKKQSTHSTSSSKHVAALSYFM